MKLPISSRQICGIDTAEAAIADAACFEGLAIAREEIMSADPFQRKALWNKYYAKKELIEENGKTVRDIEEIRALSWDQFMFGDDNLSRNEQFILAADGQDYCDIMKEEEELNARSIKTQLFHHTLKSLRKAAVKQKNYARFSFIIKWVFEHKERYNFWDLKHIFRSHKELKKMFFPNVPSAKKAA